MVQRVLAPRYAIVPKPSLRVLLFAFPTLQSENPFSISVSFINSGYSELNNVEVVELKPSLSMSASSNGSQVAWHLDGIQLDGTYIELGTETARISVGAIEPGGVRILTANIVSPDSNEGSDETEVKSKNIISDMRHYQYYFQYSISSEPCACTGSRDRCTG